MTIPVLEVCNISAGYGKHNVLKKIRFLVHEHMFIGILGPNGSGKSTLMQVLAHALTPNEGGVLLQGDEIDNLSEREFSRRLGLVPQESGIPFAYSVYDIVMMGRNPHIPRFRQPSEEDHNMVTRALEQTGTLEFSTRSITSLSGGERQRVLIARILAQDPSLLLLDEPFAHIDLHHQYELIRLIRDTTKDKKAVIGVFHDINLAASFCDHLILLHKGVIQAMGTPWEILQGPLLGEIFEISPVIGDNPITGAPYLYITEKTPDSKVHTDKIFLISGGGTGAPVITTLTKAGYTVECGILSENDADCQAAKRYGLEVITEPPFSRISAEHEDLLSLQIKRADQIVVTAMPIGWGNYPNIRVLENVAPEKIILMLPESEQIIPDFTGGAATNMVVRLLEAGARRACSISEVCELLRNQGIENHGEINHTVT